MITHVGTLIIPLHIQQLACKKAAPKQVLEALVRGLTTRIKDRREMADSLLCPTGDLVTLFARLPEQKRDPKAQPDGVRFQCSRCKQTKPRQAFQRDPRRKLGIDPRCLSCKRDDNRERTKTPEARKRLAEKHLLRTYGLTAKAFEAMKHAQDGRCAICNEELGPGRRTHVDHCHKTGRVRALLCNHCNMGVGVVERGSELIAKINEYVVRHSVHNLRLADVIP